MLGKKLGFYTYKRKNHWPKSYRYRYNLPKEFKVFKLSVVFILIFLFFFVYISENSKLEYENGLEKIRAFEVPVDVLEEAFTKDKKNNKDLATVLANYVLGKKPSIFSSKNKKRLYKEAITCYKQFIYDVKEFPLDKEYDYSYEDTWGSERNYGGNRRHYGTDIMDRNNKRGDIPIISISSGIVENIGWNHMGGYRIGIRSKGGAYIYYAHLDRYADKIYLDKRIKAGEIIGYMGDSGYGEEGTVGKFQVHLHIGIAGRSQLNSEEWINPYYILKYLEETRR